MYNPVEIQNCPLDFQIHRADPCTSMSDHKPFVRIEENVGLLTVSLKAPSTARHPIRLKNLQLCSIIVPSVRTPEISLELPVSFVCPPLLLKTVRHVHCGLVSTLDKAQDAARDRATAVHRTPRRDHNQRSNGIHLCASSGREQTYRRRMSRSAGAMA